MPTIAIVGAGPGLGLAIARKFGSEGFDVALVSRNKDKLDALVDTLAAEGIKAAGFPADVLDRPALTQALADAAAHFGRIDVLEYSPADSSGGTLAPVHIRETTPENTQAQIEYYLYGAHAATAAVLPAMLEAGAGTLLFTTGGGSTMPVPMFGNVNVAGAALRNWALNLGEAIAADGIHVGHVAIGAWITEQVPENHHGVGALAPSQIAPTYWDLHTERDAHEVILTATA